MVNDLAFFTLVLGPTATVSFATPVRAVLLIPGSRQVSHDENLVETSATRHRPSYSSDGYLRSTWGRSLEPGRVELPGSMGVVAFLFLFDRIGQPPLSPDVDLGHFTPERRDERLELFQQGLVVFHVAPEQKHHVVRSHLDHLLPLDYGPSRRRGREHEG